MLKLLKIYIRFDDEAQVYYAHELRVEVMALIPELMAANGVAVEGQAEDHRSVPFDLIIQQRNSATLARC